MYRILTCLVALLLVAAGAATASAQDASPTADESRLATLGLMELRVTVAEDGTVDLPQEVEGGRYLVVLDVAASETIQSADVTFIQVPAGMTVEEMGAQAEEAGDEGAPAWFYETVIAGGVAALSGSTASVVLELTEGEWIVEVFTESFDEDEGEGDEADDDDEDGDDLDAASPVADDDAMGEAGGPVVLTVTDAATAIAVVDIPVDQMIEAVDFDFTIPDSIPAGQQIWQITNTGSQPHHLIIEKANAPVTEEQLAELIPFEFGMAEPGATPSPDLPNPDELMVVGGVGAMSSGQMVWTELNLEPGTYIAVCFIPDAETGMPHIAMGMYEVFTVE